MSMPITWPLDPPLRLTKALFAFYPRHNGSLLTSDYATLHLFVRDARIEIGGQTFAVRPGDIVIKPPGVSGRYWYENDSSHWIAGFYPPPRKATGLSIELPVFVRLGPLATPAIEQFRRIVRLCNQPASDPAELALRMAEASCLFQAMLVWLSRHKPESERHAGPLYSDAGIANVLEYIEENLRRPLDIDKLTKVSGLSRNYLSRRFRSKFGMTISHYVLKRRIDQACELMESTDAAIQSIAAQVGLPDLQHFNKRFRRITGVSPRAFRQAMPKRRA